MNTKIGFVIAFALLVMTAACWEGSGTRNVEQKPTAPESTAASAPLPAPTKIPTATVPSKPPATLTPKPPPTLTFEPTAARLLVWVRQEPALVNPDNQALGWDYGADERRKKSFVEWQVAEESFSSRQRYQEDENIWYDDVVFRVAFERPPLVLNPQLRYALRANFSHRNGALNFGYEGLGERFLWDTDKGMLEPPAAFAYFPYASGFDGASQKEWMLGVPQPAQPGEELYVSASMLNWPPGRVIWKYVAEYH